MKEKKYKASKLSHVSIITKAMLPKEKEREEILRSDLRLELSRVFDLARIQSNMIQLI